MDRAGTRVSPLTDFVDLHLHSTASDGILAPTAVVSYAAEAGLAAIALTDHDTLNGLAEALDAGQRLGVRVIGGCEFSVQVPWGEMHLLGYFLTPSNATTDVEAVLKRARDDRSRRGEEMVMGLQAWGIDISFDHVLAEAAGAPVGRPHVARALLRREKVISLDDAFRQWLGRGRPAFVEKQLPSFAEVAGAVHQAGGIVSAAHLRDRATRASIGKLRAEGLDGIEARHPGHNPDMAARIEELARSLSILPTGGSDWHGDAPGGGSHGTIGSQRVPLAWLEAMDARRAETTMPPSAFLASDP